MFFRLIKLALTLFLLFWFLQNYGVKWALSAYLQHRLGTEVKIGAAKVDFINAQAKFSDLSIYNPLIFPEGRMIDISQLYFEWQPARLLGGEFYISELNMTVNEVRLLKTPGNGFNFYALKVFREDGESPPTSEDGLLSRVKPDLKIKQMVLSVMKGTYTDTSGEKPVEKSFDLAITRSVHKDLNGFKPVGNALLSETLKKMGVAAFKDWIS